MNEISDEDRANLLRVCCEHDLPESAAMQLLFIAQSMHPQYAQQSERQRRDDLQTVATLARDLNAALQSLEASDRLEIHRQFAQCSVRIVLDPPDRDRQFLAGLFAGEGRDLMAENVLLLGDVTLTLAGLADGVAHDIQSGSTGRPRSLDTLAVHVFRIAEVVTTCQIRIGRGGSFHAICEAVFGAAGITVDPENAIRRCLENFRAYLDFDR